MNSSDDIGGGAEFLQPPFLYEIRVKGRLSAEQWTSWFDDLTVATDKGESTLRGRVPDHAALYGLIGRLRDLAVPLVAVKVLDVEAQLKLARQSRRIDLVINLLLVVIYLALFGALAALTVFVAPVINTALALALFFALVGGAAHAFWLWSGLLPWRWLSYLSWLAAAICLLIFVPVSGILPTALGIGITLLVCAGGLLYLVYYLRRRAENIHSSLIQAEAPRSAPRPVRADREAEETAGDNPPEAR